MHWQCAPVLAVGGHSVEKINRRENSRSDGDVGPLQAERIARAIPLLVVRAHNRHDRIWETHPLQNFRPHDRVNLHFFEFFRGQPARFGNDVLRDRQFANIVQQRGCVQRLHFWGADLQFFGDFDGVHPNSLQMIVSGVIFGLNRQGQRFDGSQVEVGHLLYVPLLVFEFAQIEPVGAIDQVNNGNDQQRSFPSKSPVEPAKHACECSSHQVVRKRPEVAIHPNLVECLSFCKRDDGSDGSRVGQEVCRSR